MNNKPLLIAKREFAENLRTKTFWIGIIFFPILISLTILVPMWLEKTKDARSYAVVDHSEWLHREISQRASMPDLEKVLTQAIADYRAGNERFETYPMPVRELVTGIVDGQVEKLRTQVFDSLPEDWQQKTPEQFEKALVPIWAEAIAMVDSPEFSAAKGMLPASMFQPVIEARDQIRDWYGQLTVDEAARFGERLSKSRYVHVDVDLEGEELIAELNRRINEETLFAYFVINEDPIHSKMAGKYVSNNLTDDSLHDWFKNHASDIIRKKRLVEEEIDAEVAAWIQAPLKFDSKKVGTEGAEEEVAKEDMLRQWAPVAFVYFLWIAVFSISQMLLTNTVEEKSNRILEVLLSSVSPLQLMAGKIVGIAWTGMTMILSWVLSFIVLVTFLPGLLGAELNINLSSIARDPFLLTSFVVYFLLGYLFFAALLVGIGSVCNSVKEANNLMMPVTVTLMLPLLAMIPISKDPNGTLAVVLSYIPPFTPFVMMNRAAGPPTTFEYVATTLLLIMSIIVVFWAAAKIFRIGILMTGKPPTPMEILRWLKTPVGQIPVQQEED